MAGDGLTRRRGAHPSCGYREVPYSFIPVNLVRLNEDIVLLRRFEGVGAVASASA